MVDLALRVIASLGSGKTAVGLVGWLLLIETSVRTLAWTVAGARCEASVSVPWLHWLASSAAGGCIGPHAPRSLTKWFHSTRLYFTFFLIRPNQKKEKERRNMQSSLKRGDKILTIGGLYGAVVKAKEGEERISIEISEGVKIETERRFVSDMFDSKEKKNK
jgi:preprotein translocase subunit YajC